MSDIEVIYVDASQPVTLPHAGAATHRPTVQEAAITWHKLPAEEKEPAIIIVNNPGGRVYRQTKLGACTPDSSRTTPNACQAAPLGRVPFGRVDGRTGREMIVVLCAIPAAKGPPKPRRTFGQQLTPHGTLA